MIELHLQGNLRRITLKRAALAQMEPGGYVLNTKGKIRLLNEIAELEAVNTYLRQSL